MSRTLIGRPSQFYETLQGGKYQATTTGEIDGVEEHHVADLVKAGCVDREIATKASLAGVNALSGDGTKFLAGDGTLKTAGNFDAAGAAAAALTAAEAYADSGDAPAIDVTVTTHDATPVVAATYTPGLNTLTHIEATYLAFFQAGGDGKTRKVTAAFITDNMAAVSIVGSAVGGDVHTTSGATSATATVQTDGSVVQLVVTGINATDIDWHVLGDVTV